MTLAGAIAMGMQGAVVHYGFSAYFTSLVAEFSCSYAELSGVFSLSRLEGGLLAPVSGFLIDRWGPRRLLILGTTMIGLGFILLSRVDSLVWFYIVYALFIAVGGSFGPVATVVTAVGNWFIRRRSTAIGIVMAGFGLGGSLVFVVSWCISQYGWREVMVGGGLVCWGIGIPLALLMRHRPEQYGLRTDGDPPEKTAPITAAPGAPSHILPKTERTLEPRQVLGEPSFWLLSISFSLRQMITSSVTLHTIPFLTQLQLPGETPAAVLGIIASLSILGRLAFGWLGDHYDKRYVIVAGLALLSIAMVVMSQTTGMAGIFLYVPLYALAYGGSVPLIPAVLAEYFGRKNFATVQGFSSTVQMVGNISGPLAAGLIYDATKSYQLAFLGFAGAALVALVMVCLVRKPSGIG
jgi:sugar phosphate permease